MKFLKFTMWAVVFGGLLSSGANAGFKDGNKLLSECIQEKTLGQAVCLGYVQGVADSFVDAVFPTNEICFPEKVVAGQAQDVVIAWLKNNPAKRHYPAYIAVNLALAEAFPCATRPSP